MSLRPLSGAIADLEAVIDNPPMLLIVLIPIVISGVSSVIALRFVEPVMRNHVPFASNPKRALQNVMVATFFLAWATWAAVNFSLLAAVEAPLWAMQAIIGDGTWALPGFAARLMFVTALQVVFVTPVFLIVAMAAYFSERRKLPMPMAEKPLPSAAAGNAKKRLRWAQGIGFVIGLPISLVGLLTLLLSIGRLLGLPLLPF